MKNYSYAVMVLFLLGNLFLNSCKKSTTTVETLRVDGSYIGLLYTKTYVSFTGVTHYDTIAHDFVLHIHSDENGIILNSADTNLNNVNLEERKVHDSASAHFGNDKVYINE